MYVHTYSCMYDIFFSFSFLLYTLYIHYTYIIILTYVWYLFLILLLFFLSSFFSVFVFLSLLNQIPKQHEREILCRFEARRFEWFHRSFTGLRRLPERSQEGAITGFIICFFHPFKYFVFWKTETSISQISEPTRFFHLFFFNLLKILAFFWEKITTFCFVPSRLCSFLSKTLHLEYLES